MRKIQLEYPDDAFIVWRKVAKLVSAFEIRRQNGSRDSSPIGLWLVCLLITWQKQSWMDGYIEVKDSRCTWYNSPFLTTIEIHDRPPVRVPSGCESNMCQATQFIYAITYGSSATYLQFFRHDDRLRLHASCRNTGCLIVVTIDIIRLL